MDQYPRILIVNDESIYKKNATGITLRSLLKTWPSERALELHLWKPSQVEKEDLAIRDFQIPKRVFPIRANISWCKHRL